MGTSVPTLPEFENVLDGFVKVFGDCLGCVRGGGDPNCVVRECCKQKAYTTCAECAEMDACEKLRPAGGIALEGLRKIRAMGVDNGLRKCRRRWTQATAN